MIIILRGDVRRGCKESSEMAFPLSYCSRQFGNVFLFLFFQTCFFVNVFLCHNLPLDIMMMSDIIFFEEGRLD